MHKWVLDIRLTLFTFEGELLCKRLSKIQIFTMAVLLQRILVKTRLLSQ